MTPHLTSDECLAAADGTLEPARLGHLDRCEACRRDLESARLFVARVAASDVPNPSPMFWDHFSARVRQATAAAPPWRASWWARTGRPGFAVAAVAGAVLLAVWVVRQPVQPASRPTVADGGAASTVADAAQWESVVAVTADWSSDDIDELVPAWDGNALAIGDLTPEERVVFVQLLRDELGVLQ